MSMNLEEAAPNPITAGQDVPAAHQAPFRLTVHWADEAAQLRLEADVDLPAHASVVDVIVQTVDLLNDSIRKLHPAVPFTFSRADPGLYALMFADEDHDPEPPGTRASRRVRKQHAAQKPQPAARHALLSLGAAALEVPSRATRARAADSRR